ncbi:sigma-E processing peptidase SpoIIGA, partial [Clostridium tarantellae]
MVIYIDVVLVENFLINFFLLLITMQIVNQKVSYKRIAFSSIIGIIYIFFILVSNVKFLAYLPFKLLLAFIMIFF